MARAACVLLGQFDMGRPSHRILAGSGAVPLPERTLRWIVHPLAACYAPA